MFDKSEYMKRYRLEHPEIMQRFLENNPDYKRIHNIINNPKWHPINNPIYNPLYSRKTIRFKEKRILLKENPRKGICTKCGKKGRTDLHHENYDDSDPLKHTVELCKTCHGSISGKKGAMLRIKKK